MASTLTSQLRDITSTQGDDYFDDDYLVKLLNRAKGHLIEVGTEMERSRGVSLRFLDKLRTTQDVSFDSFTSYQDFFRTTASKPSDLLDWITLDLQGVNLAELNRTFEIKHGNAVPSAEEGYFLVYDNQFEFYLDVDTYTDFKLRYIKDHTKIVPDDEAISEMTEGAERAILYYAAALMSDSDASMPAQLFKDEFNAYVRDLI